jgi:methylthioribose-1-phosphate isomerase
MNHIQWKKDRVILLDQRKLPTEKIYIECKTVKETAVAIKDMVVRGAPAIGVTAAYGLVLSVLNKGDFLKDCELMANSRPTAVNLMWAVDRMRKCYKTANGSLEALENEAISIHKEDIEMNKQMGMLGSGLFNKKISVLTHCNAGALATGDYGTAVGVIRALHKDGKLKNVFVDETRPYLQGARLTAFELAESGIPHTLITDNTAGYLMSQGKVDVVITGADRIAANGDTANKIGTSMLAICCKYFNIPFYIAAPSSTFDMSIKSGEEIPIEKRGEDEVIYINGKRITHEKTSALHIGFDITKGDLITGFITEQGVLNPPFNLKQI